jgi:hypothetical protein
MSDDHFLQITKGAEFAGLRLSRSGSTFDLSRAEVERVIEAGSEAGEASRYVGVFALDYENVTLKATRREIDNLLDLARHATAEGMRANMHQTPSDTAKALKAEQAFEDYAEKIFQK